MKKRIEYGLLLAGLLFLYIWTNQKMALWAWVLTAGSLMVVIVLNQVIVKKLSVDCEMLQRTKDEVPCIRITLTNRGWFPANHVAATLVCENVVFGSCEEKCVHLSIGGKSTNSYEIPVHSRFCGRIDLTEVSCRVYDWFDVTYRKVPAARQGCGYAYPPENDQVLEFSKEDSKAGDEMTYKHKVGYDVSEILQIREYQKGDSIKSIHWKLSAKEGKTMVKELDCPNDNSILLLFDYISREKKEENQRILSAVNSISRELTREQKGHTIYRMDTNSECVVFREVFEYAEFDCLQRELLETEAKESPYRVSDYILDHDIIHRYARIIYVTAKGEESDLADLEQCVAVYV